MEPVEKYDIKHLQSDLRMLHFLTTKTPVKRMKHALQKEELNGT